MSPDKSAQTMKPLTAANKLGIYLPATPVEFQITPISRADLDEMRQTPPEWLEELRKSGPFPRDVVARKLGISNAGLARGGVSDALTAAQIDELVDAPPEWLVKERKNYKEVLAENERVKVKQEERRAAANRPPKNRVATQPTDRSSE